MLETFDLTKYNEALSRGLCRGKGEPDEQMCIEAAVCYAFGLPHSDNPKCVSEAVRQFKIRLNDCGWFSPQARSEGLRELGLAQLGSLGVVDDVEFLKKLLLSIANNLLPTLCKELYLVRIFHMATELVARDFYELADALFLAPNSGQAYYGYHVAASLASAVNYLHKVSDHERDKVNEHHLIRTAACTVKSIAGANLLSTHPDKYLKLAANLAVNVLKDLNSPGCQFLTR